MSKELRRARNRQMLVFLLIGSAMLVLLCRLYYWQVLQSHSGHNLAQQANDEHVQNLVLNAPRGLIYDNQRRILATNVVRDDVYVEPIQFSIDHPDNTQSYLNTLIDSLHSVMPKVSLDKLHAAFNSSLQTVRIAVDINPAQSQRLRNLQLPDVFLQPRTWRTYPSGTLAAQILGYVTQNENNNQGVYGIEGQYNALLSGKPGSLTAETDLNGNPLVVGASAEQPAVNGANLTLTIDSSIQYMVETMLAATVKQMEAESGTVVIINAHTGAIIAMAGEPTFDPNDYGHYATLRGCLGSEEVYFNPALYCAYEPGSTMKSVTMAAALDQRLITPDTTLNDPGYISFKDAPPVWNWEDRGYGTETMTQVLEHSANVGAAYVAHNILGPDRFYPYVTRFGLGQPIGIDGPEISGYYRSPTSNPQGWTVSDLTRQAFGQSILVTPLQMAMVYETIANGGVMMHPYLVSRIDNNGNIATTQPQVERRVISAYAAQLLKGMLVEASNHALSFTGLVPGYTVAAKTGTATTQGISSDQTEASVAGFLPASNPQFVILVKIDRPQAAIYGSTAAAPLWKNIAQQLMWYYHVAPDNPTTNQMNIND